MPTLDMYLIWTAQAALGLIVGLAIPVLYRIYRMRFRNIPKLWILVVLGTVAYFGALFALQAYSTGLLIFLIIVQGFCAFTLHRANSFIRSIENKDTLYANSGYTSIASRSPGQFPYHPKRDHSGPDA